jgi:hypothetical protein
MLSEPTLRIPLQFFVSELNATAIEIFRFKELNCLFSPRITAHDLQMASARPNVSADLIWEIVRKYYHFDLQGSQPVDLV